jgi:hypothetical protein
MSTIQAPRDGGQRLFAEQTQTPLSRPSETTQEQAIPKIEGNAPIQTTKS